MQILAYELFEFTIGVLIENFIFHIAAEVMETEELSYYVGKVSFDRQSFRNSGKPK